MVSIKKITLVQYRNYTHSVFEFVAPVTCITGPNGSGKTNLLDAVYYLCYTKSYFTALQQNNVQNGMDGFRLAGVFAGRDGDETISCKWRAGKKEVFSGDKEYEKVTDHIGRWPSVMIAPDDTELINGASDLRRKWMDGILSQVDKLYLERLLHYQRLLLQRNAWLKNHALNTTPDYTELEFYNAQMAVDAAYIFDCRRQFLHRFLPLLEGFYHNLSGGSEAIAVTYASDLFQRPLQDWLTQGLQHDLRYQRTLRGIHKDDWELTLNGIALKAFGSQGQKKSFLFALKLAQYRYLQQCLVTTPILLLDDIFEKLDQQRMEALLRVINGPGFGQVILTDTHPGRVKEAFGGSMELGFVYL